MPSATVEELQTQLAKAEEDKAAAVKSAEKKVRKEIEASTEDGGKYKKSKGGVAPKGEENEARKAERKAAKKAAREAAEALTKADLPAEVRAALEKAEDDNKALAKRLEKAEKAELESATIAKEERDRRIVKEFISKAEEDYPSLALDASEFGPVLKSMHDKLSKEDVEAVEGILKSAEEIVRKSVLFEELGKGGAPVAGDALAKMQKAAEEIRKADPKISADEALAKAMDGNRELQAEYLQEVR